MKYEFGKCPMPDGFDGAEPLDAKLRRIAAQKAQEEEKKAKASAKDKKSKKKKDKKKKDKKKGKKKKKKSSSSSSSDTSDSSAMMIRKRKEREEELKEAAEKVAAKADRAAKTRAGLLEKTEADEPEAAPSVEMIFQGFENKDGLKHLTAASVPVAGQ